MISAGMMISRITEKPFDFSNGHRPGIKPMFEYQVEKTIFGGYYYTYGIGYKGLGENRYKVFENLKYYDIKISNAENYWRLDTVFTYSGDLKNKHRIKMFYFYFPVGITYYTGERLSFGVEYSLAWVWGGKFNSDASYSDVINNFNIAYSADADLPGNKRTNDNLIYRWDHWLRFSARYKYKDYLFRLGFEKGLRNIVTGKDIINLENQSILRSKGYFWQNKSIFLSVGVKLPNG
jgi:hypothetical protein